MDVITGPLKKIAPDTFVVRFGRVGFDNGKRSGGIWLQATLDGDDVYNRAVQQAALNIPIRNTAGAPQTLTLAPLADQPLGTATLPLQAKSSAGVPVSYYVLEGPAEIENGALTFSALPPRTKTPVKVTVVAYHWGRPTGERLQSAEPVARTFYLLAPGEKSPDASQQARAQANLDAIWAEAAARIAALAAVANAPATPDTFGRGYSFNFTQSPSLAPDDRAGDLTPLAHWNKITDLQPGKTIQLRNIPDSAGEIGRLSVTVTGGASRSPAPTLDLNKNASAAVGDARLFNGVYDQSDGAATTLSVFGIPYENYDVVFYRADDGPQRAGRFQAGNRVLYARGGRGGPGAASGTASGTLLAVADATYGEGVDIGQGNVIRFKNLTGDRFTATFSAVFAGDKVRRNKVAGFQIIERK